MAAISWSDRWGVAHLGLTSLIVIALMWLAAANSSTGGRWRFVLLGGLAVDAAIGLILHFYLEFTAHLSGADWKNFFQDQEFTYASAVGQNAWLKTVNKLMFVADAAPHPALVALLITAFAALALRRIFVAPHAPTPPAARSNV